MATAEKQIASIAPTKNTVVNAVIEKIGKLQDSGHLALPANYSPQNALMSAYLTLQTTVDKEKRPVLQTCTQESIANSLLDMVIQGLNPARKQCYFIAYGNQLVCQRSYFGTMTVAKRITKAMKDPQAECVYEGDEFEYEIRGANKYITKHAQKLASIDKSKIIGAYATLFLPSGETITEVMTIDQIKQAWRQSRQNPFDEKGNLIPNSVHGKFTEEMAKKTVLGRVCKSVINSSDDSSLDLVVESYRRSEDVADEAQFAEEVADKANAEVLDAEFEEKPDVEGQPEATKIEAEDRKPETKQQAKKDRGF